ncbi:hypothetical protein IT575_13340 [bacterium]|nr:hypothetical protein [bacterium]
MRGIRKVLLTLLALLSGCASDGPPSDGPTSRAEAMEGGISLPAPAALLELRASAAYSSDERWRHGSQWDELLPYKSVTQSGLLGVFEPASAEGADGLGGCAWCIYSFQLPAYLDAPTLRLEWEDEPDLLPGTPEDPGPRPGWWVALANFDTSRWDLFPAPPDGLLKIPQQPGALNLAPYRDSETGAILATVLVRSPGVSKLSRVQLGGEGWVHTWGGEFYEDYYGDNFTSMAITSSGDLVAAGYAQDLIAPVIGLSVVKYSAGGKLLWQRLYTGAYRGSRMVVAPDDSIYLSGCTDFEGLIRLLKVDANGVLEWQRAFQLAEIADLQTNGMAIGADGSVYVASYYEGLGEYSGLVVKYSSDGDLLWAKDIGHSDDFDLHGISIGICADESSVYVCGVPSICKLDLSGNLLWQRDFDLTEKWGTKVALDATGAPQLVWQTYSKCYVSGFDTGGSITYTHELPMFGNGTVKDLVPTHQGLSILVEDWSSATLINFGLYDAIGAISTLALSDNMYPGGHCYDSDGSLYLAGGLHTPEGLQLDFTAEEYASVPRDIDVLESSFLAEDAVGAEPDLPGDLLFVAALEDDLRPGIVSDIPGIVLKHEF